MTKRKITVRLIFGAVQALLAFLAMILALILKFDLFNIQFAMNIAKDAVNFDVVILLAVGLITFIGGAFLVYDWWEST